MHESTLMAGVIRRVERVAGDAGADEVTRVHLWLGALAHISPEHLREHFEIAARGTVAAGAQVEIDESGDIDDPNAQEIILTAVEVAE
jgi:hydrogenase nickel incorporation protein HypA/HybF